MVGVACEQNPDMCTLVPEKREERATEGGLAVAADLPRMTSVVSRLKDAGIRVSLFIVPEESEIEASQKVGADMVEFHTGEYCNAPKNRVNAELARIVTASKAAHELGMAVAAGHGLHYHNVRPISEIEEVIELNIGHSIISRVVYVGMDAAVRQMLRAMGER